MRGSVVLLVLCGLAFAANAQTCTTTAGLNVRSCPGTSWAVSKVLAQGASVSVSGASVNADGYTWVPIGNNNWVANMYLSCSNNVPPPPPPSGGSGGSLSSFPSTYSASGYTYQGNSARVLHFLKDRFGATATTYASHSDGATASADLWTAGAASARDNSGVASMNSLADYIASSRDALGIYYVIWKQRINTGSGWRAMEDRGSITQNHFDHVHITFSNPSASAIGDESDLATIGDSANVADPDLANPVTLHPWAIGVIVAGVVGVVIAIVVIVMVKRANRLASADKV